MLDFIQGLSWATVMEWGERYLWEVSLVLSVSLLIFWTLLLYSACNVKFWYSLFVGVACSVLVIFYPINRAAFGAWSNDFTQNFLQFFQILFRSGYNTAGVLAVKLGYLGATANDILSLTDGMIAYVYILYTHILFLGAAVVTLGSSISVLKELTPNRKPRENGLRHVYAFSELNEKSLALARDYKKQKENKKAVIVFAGINTETNSRLLHEARKMHAICLKNDITVLNFKGILFLRITNWAKKVASKVVPVFNESFPKNETIQDKPEKKDKPKKKQKKKSQKNYIKFFLIGKNEDQNLIQSLSLIEKYKERMKTEIYVFSKKVESGLVLSSVDTGEIKVRRINEVRSLINRILLDDGPRLFQNAHEESGLKTISALIIGLGHHGTEMLKALAWYGQMDGYSIEINAFDKSKSAESKFSIIAPGLIKTAPSGNVTEKKDYARYHIRIHPDVDVDSQSFVDTIKKMTDVTYIFVALGNDEDNIRMAVNMRTHFERNAKHSPIIQTVVYNSNLKQALQETPVCKDGAPKPLPVCKLKTFDGISYRIEFVGDIATAYTKAVIEPEALEQKALKFHMKYVQPDCTPEEYEEERKNFWRYEYNYNSSISAAIHNEATRACKIPGADKPEDERSKEEKERLGQLEHRRWVAYMSGNGYEHGEAKNHLAKTHPDLIDYSDLSEKKQKRIVS